MARQSETLDPLLRVARDKSVEAIASGADLAAASDAAGVDRETLRGWLDGDAEFIASLNRAKLERVDRLRSEVRGLASEAVATLRTLISGPEIPPPVRLRAALAILEVADAMRVEEIGSTCAAEIRGELSRRNFLTNLGI
jgi:hypothetical protein